jgi:hypothetical protein
VLSQFFCCPVDQGGPVHRHRQCGLPRASQILLIETGMSRCTIIPVRQRKTQAIEREGFMV